MTGLIFCWLEAARNFATVAFGVLGIILFARRNIISDKSNATAEKQIRISKDMAEDQIFLSAVALFEKHNQDVRLGAVLALERIATKNLNYSNTIMGMFCHFIRENSHKGRKGKGAMYMRSDITAMLSALICRPTTEIRSPILLDLSGSYLSGGLMLTTDFSGASFDSCQIDEFTFQDVNLSECSFRDANLNNTNFTKSIINGCDFEAATLYGTDLSGIKIPPDDSKELGDLIETLQKTSISLNGQAIENSDYLTTVRRAKFEMQSDTKLPKGLDAVALEGGGFQIIRSYR